MERVCLRNKKALANFLTYVLYNNNLISLPPLALNIAITYCVLDIRFLSELRFKLYLNLKYHAEEVLDHGNTVR